MKSEFDGNTKTGTFPMVDRVPRGRKPVSSKWCFGFKTDEKGKITKLKARLVGRGFTQIREVDYTHSSSPCPSSASVKLILAVANEKGLPLCHFDVAQAYIRGSLGEEVYMKLVGGCGKQSKRTAKLERVIYGLKQSGRSPGGDWSVKEAVGSLMWLSIIARPDSINAVRAVARYTHEPTEILWQAIMEILSYLNGTKRLGITYVRGSALSLNMYADADNANKENNRPSVSGIALTLGGTVVSHASKTQRAVSLSTSEAEYITAGGRCQRSFICACCFVFHCARDVWGKYKSP